MEYKDNYITWGIALVAILILGWVVINGSMSTNSSNLFEYTGSSASANEHLDKESEYIAITNVNIFDGVSDRLTAGHVLIKNNLIEKVSSSELDIPNGATTIDGQGRTLMPGLIDGHSHLAFTQDGGVPGLEDMTWDEIGARSVVAAEDWLMLGFTTTRDMGGMATGLKKTIDNELTPGPRIYPSGAILSQTSGHADFRKFPMRSASITGLFDSNSERLGISLTVNGVAEMLAGVRQNLMQGATQIKLMTGGGVASQLDPIHTMGFTSEEIETAVAAAEDWGTYVAVHVFSPEGITRSLNAGAKTDNERRENLQEYNLIFTC